MDQRKCDNQMLTLDAMSRTCILRQLQQRGGGVDALNCNQIVRALAGEERGKQVVQVGAVLSYCDALGDALLASSGCKPFTDSNTF